MDYDLFCQSHPVSRETFDRLHGYVTLLEKWQQRINLVSPDSIRSVWDRHILDSCQLIPHLPAGSAPILDIGSGAGLPGLVIACHGIAVHLVESDRRKAIFLEEVSRQLSLPATISSQRIEHLTAQSMACITARACASIDQLLHWSENWRVDETICLFPKGQSYAMELESAAQHWSFRNRIIPSITNKNAAIILLTHIARRF